jgi:hypothetical protein
MDIRARARLVNRLADAFEANLDQLYRLTVILRCEPLRASKDVQRAPLSHPSFEARRRGEHLRMTDKPCARVFRTSSFRDGASAPDPESRDSGFDTIGPR